MQAIAIVFSGLAGLAGLVNLICWIMTLIKMFGDEANGGVGKGIFGFICGLYAFIWGWQNADQHDHKNVMLAWSAGFAVTIVANIIAGALAGMGS